MPIKNQRRGGNSSQQHLAAIWGGGLLVLLLIVVGVAYYSSPYFATDSAAARMVDKTLPATMSDDELRAISSNLYAALDQVVPGGQGDAPESVLAQVGLALTREVRSQLLLQASRRLASREGVDLALYGWQHISDHRVSIRRGIGRFDGWHSADRACIFEKRFRKLDHGCGASELVTQPCDCLLAQDR